MNPLADKARSAVQGAIRRGDLARGDCEWARFPELLRGCEHYARPVEAHHEDYDKPLDVIWLCPWHHRQLHHERRHQRKALLVKEEA